MAFYWFCTVVFHVFLPTVILFVVLLRPTFTSYTYLVVACVCPLFPSPDEKSMRGKSATFIKILILTAFLNCVMFSASFLIIYYPTTTETIHFCDSLEKVLRQLGYIDFGKDLSTISGFIWFIPEALVLTTSILVYFVLKRFTKDARELSLTEEMGLSEAEVTENTTKTKDKRQRIKKGLSVIGKCAITLLLCTSSIVRPSIFGAIYFLVFLSIVTWWGFYRKLKLSFAVATLPLLPLLFVHMSVIYVYQFQFFQENTNRNGLLTRIFNVNPYMSVDCKDAREWHVDKIELIFQSCVFLQIYLTFNLIIHVAKQIFYDWRLEKEYEANKWKKAFAMMKQSRSEEERLKAKQLAMTEEELAGNTLRQKIFRFFYIIFRYIIQLSYLPCNFILMIWGVSHFGWKTAVFLVWSNCVWLLPKQKYVIHLASPVVMVWVWFVMITAYLYSMKFTANEVPSSALLMDWASGVKRNVPTPFVDLFVQSLFTIMCAVCLRQFMHERSIRKQRDDLVAVAGETNAKLDLHDNELFDRFQVPFYTKRQFALYFIWILAAYIAYLPYLGYTTPLGCIYLFLFILFTLSFELLPFNIWKGFLWFVWWFAILNGMLHLFVRYFYQYDDIQEIANKKWKMEYLFVNILRYTRVSSWVLFHEMLILVTLIIFLLIEIHYLQKVFNRITNATNTEYFILAEDSLPKETGDDTIYLKIKRTYFTLKNFFCLMCEFHMRKVILLVVMWEVVSQKAALYFPVVVLICLYPFLGKYLMNIVIHLISTYIQLFLVLRVFYMVFMPKHADYNVTCRFKRDSKNYAVTRNTMEWLGFRLWHQQLQGSCLQEFVFVYVFIALVCVEKAAVIRQKNIRRFRGLPTKRPDVMYPNVTVENREDSLPNMIKYLLNYGFYKFGVELTFIAIAFGMVMRMDVFFMLHGVILLLICAIPRKHLARIWLPLMVLFNGLIPYQYFNAIGWFPSKCSISFFWNRNEIFIKSQKLLFMRNDAYPPVAPKIFFDMIVLLFMSRQWKVFCIERSSAGKSYAGGSNQSTIHLIEDKEFVNPVPDFVTNQRNYLDVVKKVVLCHAYYVTLIFMYIAGTENIGTYSILYIIFSIVYFWHGAEMFLYPIKTVIRSLNYMITYTIVVLLLRMANQIYSCIFIFYNLGFKCYWQQPFAFGCGERFHDFADVPDLKVTPRCPYTNQHMGIALHLCCFTLLLFQRRLVQSYNFFHIINDVKLYTILASRGAHFIHALRLKKIKDFKDEEILITQNIQDKLSRIEANHRKIQGERYLQQRKKRHKATVRSGDYYLFDELAKNDISIVPPKPPKIELDDSDPLDPLPLSDLLLLLLRTNASIVLQERQMRQEMKKAQKEKSAISAKKADAASTLPIAHAASSLISDSRKDKKSFWLRLKQKLILMLAILESTTVSVTLMFNRGSREYQSIVRQMHKERIQILKTPYYVGRRNGSQKFWQPTKEYEEYVPNTNAKDDKKDEPTSLTFNIYGKLFISFYYYLLSSTQWLCYLMIILNQLLWNNFFTIMLPIMVFCWGALTTPKPTRTFWITMIYYVLVMVIVKAVFAIPYFEYNKRDTTDPFYPPYLMGLSRNFEVFFTLTFFLTLFLHRSVLKSMGLWKPTDYRKTYLHDGDYALVDDTLVPDRSDGSVAGPSTSRPRNVPSGSQSFSIQSTKVPIATYFPRSFIPGLVKYGEGIRSYFQNLIEPEFSVPKDYYTLMFLSDLISLLILLFSFESFHSETEEDDGLFEFLTDNRIPGVFVAVVVTHFSLLLVDRGIYLRKNRLMKLVFNTTLVLVYHIWLNILVPLYTTKLMIVNSRVQAFYFFKCIYLLVSAFQVAAGYPPRIRSHCLWHSFSVFNRVAYKVFMKIPYLFHLRAAVDWTITDTTLSFMDWFKMEEISSTIFEQKCQQEYEATFVHEAGTRRNRTVKYIMGSFIVLGLWMVIIAPLVLFSMGQSVGKAVDIHHVDMDVRIGRFQPIYTGYAVDDNIHMFTKSEFDQLQVIFSNIKTSRRTFKDYTSEDVKSIRFSTRSTTNWDISPPDLKEMKKIVRSNQQLKVRLLFSIVIDLPAGRETIEYRTSLSIDPFPDTNRQNLLEMLMFNKTAKPLRLKRYWPKFLHVSREKKATVINGLLEESKSGKPNNERNVFLKLRSLGDSKWWEMREQCNENDINYYMYLQNIATSTCDQLVLFTMGEKHFPKYLGSITEKGIIGMYLLYFFMIYGIVANFFVKIEEIWIEDLPYCDRIWNKCLEVYIARDMKSFQMEEEMVAELLFIMRSHEIAIKLSRPPISSYNPTFLTPTR